ncbi:MAG: hypothetical protein ACIAS6_12445 [Phycisphaerales bacterium JB060]
MKTIAMLLVFGVLTVSGCRTAEPLPEVMSDAEWEARLEKLDQWRAAQTEACGDDIECKKAVMDEYMERIDALFEERLAQTQARWDAQRRR